MELLILTPFTEETALAGVLCAAREAFLTGSRAFGVAGPTSDWDIAISIEHAVTVRDALCRQYATTAEESDYNAGFKIETPQGELNIVPLHPLDLLCWYLTTQHVKLCCQMVPGFRERIMDRTKKLGAFEVLSGWHKMLIPYEGSEKMNDHLAGIKAGKMVV